MQKTDRFVSLDALRGLTILAMIMVNTHGEGVSYGFLTHSAWNGCTVADVVYPFFLYMVGASMWFSFRKCNHEFTGGILRKISVRAIVLFALGLVINNFPFTAPPSVWRIPGILQRTAFVYVLASVIVLSLKDTRKILAVALLLLIGYRVTLMIFGNTIENNPSYPVDVLIFGKEHLYSGYGGRFEPEGFIGSFPSTVNALAGYIFSRYLSQAHKLNRRPLFMGVCGVVMTALALLWNTVLPFNKPLWSSSFALFTCGLATLAWFILYYLIDIFGFKAVARPFVVFGTNALFAYVLSELLVVSNWSFGFDVNGHLCHISQWLDSYVYHPLTSGPMRSALWGITVSLFCWLVNFCLYRKKIYIKI
ncbi:MAG: heparan-alpha-glucosaminide N-acetyltransferase domain-containing protein [Bacteroidales bacterium]|nr:heparan-alpha-glucosaminide N-acetyltransferase domain-containing protein [Bacteroidales bacterium]